MTTARTGAVILAAGMGVRLRAVSGSTPKGLIPLETTSPVERAVSLLDARGVAPIVIVVGFEAGQYRAFARRHPTVTLVENSGFATTGSMASLRQALPAMRGGFLLLESDLVFEARAIDAALASPAESVVVASQPTGATDEVWVDARDGALRGLSKDRDSLPGVCGEFVGVCKVSAAFAAGMDAALDRHAAAHGNLLMDYETGAMVEAARAHRVDVVLFNDLIWGEIDNEFHYARVTREVLPAILAREAGSPG